MTEEPLPLEYELEPDQCCTLCNPLSFADFETTCVAVRRAGGNRVYVCVDCVRLMKRTWNSRAPQTNAEARAAWGRRAKRKPLSEAFQLVQAYRQPKKGSDHG